MLSSHLEASLLNEVRIYDLIPGLRKNSFSFPIWYDEVPEAIRLNEDYLRSYHKREMLKSKTIVNNNLWTDIWKKSYSNVEAMMSSFYQICDHDLDSAINFLFEQLRQKENKNGIIYSKEVKLFSEIYLKFKKDTIA